MTAITVASDKSLTEPNKPPCDCSVLGWIKLDALFELNSLEELLFDPKDGVSALIGEPKSEDEAVLPKVDTRGAPNPELEPPKLLDELGTVVPNNVCLELPNKLPLVRDDPKSDDWQDGFPNTVVVAGNERELGFVNLEPGFEPL